MIKTLSRPLVPLAQRLHARNAAAAPALPPEMAAALAHPQYIPGRPIAEQPFAVWATWWAIARPGLPLPCP